MSQAFDISGGTVRFLCRCTRVSLNHITLKPKKHSTNTENTDTDRYSISLQYTTFSFIRLIVTDRDESVLMHSFKRRDFILVSKKR